MLLVLGEFSIFWAILNFLLIKGRWSSFSWFLFSFSSIKTSLWTGVFNIILSIWNGNTWFFLDWFLTDYLVWTSPFIINTVWTLFSIYWSYCGNIHQVFDTLLPTLNASFVLTTHHSLVHSYTATIKASKQISVHFWQGYSYYKEVKYSVRFLCSLLSGCSPPHDSFINSISGYQEIILNNCSNNIS